MSFRITRFINGITINGKESLLDREDNPLKFDTQADALSHLQEATGEDLSAEQFEEVYGIHIDEEE